MEDVPLDRILTLIPAFAVKDLPLGRTDGKWVPFTTRFTLMYRKMSQGAKSVNMEDVQVFECVLLGRN